MQGYIIRRIIGAIFVVFLTGTFSFFAIRILPGDAASAALGLDAGSASPEQIEERRAEYGLDKPLVTQYGNWLWETVRLDLGNSFTNRGNSVWYEIGRSLPYSVELGILIMIVGFSVAFPVGLLSAIFQDRWIDYTLRSLAILPLAAPVFWTASSTRVSGCRRSLPCLNSTARLWSQKSIQPCWRASAEPAEAYCASFEASRSAGSD